MPLDDQCAVECRGLGRTYRVDGRAVAALIDIDLRIAASTFTAIVGPSGSGKSSLLRLLAGMDEADDGTVALAGRRLDVMSRRDRARMRREHIGFVRQTPADNLLDYLTVRQHLKLGAKIRGVRSDAMPDVLDALGMSKRSDSLPRHLSGGEQQRAAIAFAAVGPPTVLLADEPTSQLDHGHAGDVVHALRKIADAGVTVIVATHDPAVWQSADRAVRLRSGRIEAA